MNNISFDEFKQDIRNSIPGDVLEKIDGAAGDKEVCRILAENNVNLSAIEQKIKDSGIDMKRVGLQLPDDNLGEIAGGWDDSDYGYVRCLNCGNSDRRQFSRQFWTSLLSIHTKAIYRCKSCNHYLRVIAKDQFVDYTSDQYERDLNVTFED